jgi:hypothetical protein
MAYTPLDPTRKQNFISNQRSTTKIRSAAALASHRSMKRPTAMLNHKLRAM